MKFPAKSPVYLSGLNYKLLLVFTLASYLAAAQPKTDWLKKPIAHTTETMSLAAWLDYLSTRAGFDYAYNPVTIDARKSYALPPFATTEEALKELRKAFQLEIVPKAGQSIVLKPATPAPKKVAAQSKLSGKVSDPKTRAPIPEAGVYLTTTGDYTTTGKQGDYQFILPYPKLKSDLLIVAHGYAPVKKSLNIQGNTFLNTTLQTDTVGVKVPDLQTRAKVDKHAPMLPNLLPIPEATEQPLPGDSLGSSPKVFEQVPFSFSLWPGVSSGRWIPTATIPNLSLNLVAGSNAGVRGLEFGIFANVLQADLEGLQASGMFNVVGGQIAGVSVAGLAGYARLGVTGMQANGLLGINHGNLTGLQAAGIYNATRKHANGMQAAGVANKAQTIKGLQVAGVFNHAREVQGMQVGLINHTCTLKGLQIGLVNIADTARGFPLGLVNITRHGMTELQLDYAENHLASMRLLTYKKALHWVYAGTVSPLDSSVKVWAGMGLGTAFGLTRKKDLLDFMFNAINQIPLANIQVRQTWLSAEAALSLRLWGGLRLKAGAEINYIMHERNALGKQLFIPERKPNNFVTTNDSVSWVHVKAGLGLRF